MSTTTATTMEESCPKDCECHHVQVVEPSSKKIRKDLLAVTCPDHTDDALLQQQQNEMVVQDSPSSLDAIFDESVQLAVWRRLVPEFVTILADSNADMLPNFYGKVTPSTVCNLMMQQLKNNCCLSDYYLTQLVNDVQHLVTVFESLVQTTGEIHVRLESVNHNGFAYWHQDTVPMRMVTTYRGPCTEYVPPQYSQCTLKNRQSNSPHALSLTHADVALFKGREFEMEEDDEEDSDDKDMEIVPEGSGIVHRSPRMEGSGVTRLVLVLDIPSDFHEVSSDDEGDDTGAEDVTEEDS